MDAQQHRPPHQSLLKHPHALVFPWPGQGHINPMMQVSRKLARNGFTVTFVNTERNHGLLMRSISKEAITAAEDGALDIRLVTVPDDRFPTFQRALYFEAFCVAVLELGPLLEEVLRREMQKDPPITCLISDVFTPFTQDVASKFGIPQIALWTQSAISLASDLILTDLTSGATIETLQKMDLSNRIIDIPGAIPLKYSDLNSFMRPLDSSDLLLDFMISTFKRLNQSNFILMNTFEELESIVLSKLAKENQIYAIGPLLPSGIFTKSLPFNSTASLFPEETDCIAWLDGFPTSSVLYVSLGSTTILSAAEIEELALGLEASDQPFLWVIRRDLMLGASAILPQGFTDRVKPRAHFTSWAPQLHVLTHPSVGGFLTHCGWNSTLESMSAGVPMIGWPYFADQMTNCTSVVDWWKIGLSLGVDNNRKVDRREVERKVRALMEEEEGWGLRNRAAKIRDAAERAAGGAGGGLEGSSQREWARFLHDLTQVLEGPAAAPH
eukprot:c27881_g2_i1 orf=185-1675(-)